MSELATFYTRLMHYGLLAIRDAARVNDNEWAKAEAEFLHNIPSLMDEPNIHRHEYFWNAERKAYIDWVNAFGDERPRERMRIYYQPIWQEMAPVIADLLLTARSTS